MKICFVADENTIINTQGVRFVEKIDNTGRSFGPDTFSLRVTYKGSELTYPYADKAARDAQYAKLKEMLTS